MFKRVCAILFFITSLTVTAQIEVPDTVRDQITNEVISEQGYYDAATIEERIREWQMQQPQPKASGEMTESGNCNGSCEQTGGDASLPMPRDVKFKGKMVDGEYTQNLIIKWKRPQALPEGSSYKLKNYKIIVSKDGTIYEKFKVKAKFKNNGKPKKHQKLKLRGLEPGNYTVQVRAKYKDTSTTANKTTNNKSTGASSPWSSSVSASSKKGDYTVGDVKGISGIVFQCLLDDGYENVFNQLQAVTNSTLLSDVVSLACIEKGLVDADVQLIGDYMTGLTYLDIKKNPSISNIAPLGGLAHLSWLNLTRNAAVDLSPLGNGTWFDSLETLYLGRLNLTQIPVIPDSVTLLGLAQNQISDNAGGYYPADPLDTLIMNNQKAFWDPAGTAHGPLVLNDQFLLNLVANNVEVKTFKAYHTVITKLSNLAGLTGLENLDIWNADLEPTQRLDNISGFCSLSIRSDQMIKLTKKRPVHYLDLSDSPLLKNVTLLRSISTDHQYRPVSRTLTGSNALFCTAYYDILDSTEPLVSTPGAVQPFNLVNGDPAVIPSCPTTSPVTPVLNHAAYCKPDQLAYGAVRVYEDSATSKRFISWTQNPLHDYARWGVTQYKITSYLGAQLISVKYQSADLPTRLIDTDMTPDRYVIQACTEHTCGYERESTAAILPGLTQVTDLEQSWNPDGTAVIEFSYPLASYNDTSGASRPEYFKVTPVYPQSGSAAAIPDVTVNGYQSAWYSPHINTSLYVGKTYQVQACRNDIGCGQATEITLRKPSEQLNVAAISGLSASVNGNMITLNWAHNIDANLVDYIEVSETQPQMQVGYKAVLNTLPSNVSYKNNRYYTDQLDQPLVVERAINGQYDFELRACRRDREVGDACSAASSVSAEVAQTSLVPDGIDLTPGNPQFPSSTDLGVHEVNFTQQNDHWENWPYQTKGYYIQFQYDTAQITGKAPDYFYFERISDGGGEACVAKHPDRQAGSGYAFKDLNSFVLENTQENKSGTDTFTTRNHCMTKNKRGTWAISACFTGVGCGDAVTLNMSTGSVETLDITNTDSYVTDFVLDTTSTPPGSGSAGIAPGMYWDRNQSGTGWQFHWATHINGRDTESIDHRVAFDLVAYWFAYSKIDSAPGYTKSSSIWTPTWYKAELKRVDDSSVFEGELIEFNKVNASSMTPTYKRVNVGIMRVDMNDTNPEDLELMVTVDFESSDLASLIENDSAYDIPCDDGFLGDAECRFSLQNYSIHGVDGGQTGGSAGRFGYGNDDDHYSGVWAHNQNDVYHVAETAIITTIHRGLEVSWIATFDDPDGSGESRPIWAIGETCDGSVCNRSDASYFTNYINDGDDATNIYSIKQGFNPLKFTPEGFWEDESHNPKMVGKFGRCFGTSGYNVGQYYLDMDINNANVLNRSAVFTQGSEPSGTTCDSNQIGTFKIAGNHYIGYNIDQDSAITDQICDPNSEHGPGKCVISFDWYTNGAFADLLPFYQKNGGSWQPFTDANLCENTIDTTPTGYVVKGLSCVMHNPMGASDDVYNFELRKRKYQSLYPSQVVPEDYVAIAESKTLTIKACPGSGCNVPVQTIPPEAITSDPNIDPVNPDIITTHEDGSGPIPGSGGVSGGAAVYNLPLVLPPGRNGMTPSVSVNYSSKGGHGTMGMGWSLSAGSNIYRCPKTVAQDGFSQSLRFNNQDRLCLDGQRLVLITSNDTGDASSDVAYWNADAEYRTEMDSFTKVIKTTTGQDSPFEVYMKSGRVNTYERQGTQQSTWQLVAEKDVYGNSIIYTYNEIDGEAQDYGTNEWLLTEIWYTGTGSTKGNRKVEFDYVDTADGQSVYEISYLYGEAVEQTHLLSSISTQVDGTTVRSYDFSYRQSDANNNFLLLGASETSQGVTRDLLNTDWSDTGWTFDQLNSQSYQDVSSTITSGLNHAALGQDLINNLQIQADFNGDGIKEVMATGKRRSASNPGNNTLLSFMDQNGQVQKVIDFAGGGLGPIATSGTADLNVDGYTDLIATTTSACGNGASQSSLAVLSWMNDKTIDDGSGEDAHHAAVSDYFEQFNLCDIEINEYTQDNLTVKVDLQKSLIYLYDYTNDGKQDIIMHRVAHEDNYTQPGSSLNPCAFDQQPGDPNNPTCLLFNNQLIGFENQSEYVATGSEQPGEVGGIVNLKFSSTPDILVDDLWPFVERESPGQEGEFDEYHWDVIEFVDDLNGDNLPDYVIRRNEVQVDPNAVGFVNITAIHVGFTTYDQSTDTYGMQKIPLDGLGISGLMCEQIQPDGSVIEKSCNESSRPNLALTNTSYKFTDINSDGLQDFVYFDKWMLTNVGVDENGHTIYEKDYNLVRKWKARLNQGGAIGTGLFSSDTLTAPALPSTQDFLPEGDECVNPTSASSLRLCNQYFRAAIQFVDLNNDGDNELLFPEFNMDDTYALDTGNGSTIDLPTKLPFNHCGLYDARESRLAGDGLSAVGGSPFIYEVDFAEEILAGAPMATDVTPEAGRIDFDPVGNRSTSAFQAVFCSYNHSGGGQAPIVTDTGARVIDMYEEAPDSSNASSDLGTYRFNAIEFKVGSGNTLVLNTSNQTGIYKRLHSGIVGDFTGDGLVETFGTMGCTPDRNGDEDTYCTDESDSFALYEPAFNSSGWNWFDGNGNQATDEIAPSDFFTQFGIAVSSKRTLDAPDLLTAVTKPDRNQMVQWDHYPISYQLGLDQADRSSFPLYVLPERGDSSENGYIEDVGAIGTHFFFNSSMYVVSEMRQSTGLEASGSPVFSKNQYAYEEAVYNNQGRGFQGFRTIRVKTIPDAGHPFFNVTESVSTFNQVFPKAGKLESVEVFQNTSEGFSLVESSGYSWSDDNLSTTDLAGKGVWFVPMTSSTQTKYDYKANGDRFDVMNTQQSYSGCDLSGSDVDGYDDYGNVLCQITVMTETVDVMEDHDNDHATEHQNVKFKTVTTNKTRNHYLYDDIDIWWVDKLQNSVVTSTISEVGSHSGHDDYSTTGLSRHTESQFIWDTDVSKPRQLACQYTAGYDVQGQLTCSNNITRNDLVRNTFAYDSYGNITSTMTSGLGTHNSAGIQSRETSTSYVDPDLPLNSVHQGYFATQVSNESLTTIMSYDDETGLVLTQTDPNDVITKSDYHAFDAPKSSTTYVGTDEGDDANLLDKTTFSKSRNCLAGNSNECSVEQSLVSRVMGYLHSEMPANTGFFFQGAQPRVPELIYIAETYQDGAPVTTNWLDQNGEVVLSRIQHSGGDAHVLSLTNPLGQLELVTEPFVKTITESPYYTFNTYDERGRLFSKQVDAGSLTAGSEDSCMRNTLYDTIGGRTEVTATTSGCSNTGHTSLNMYRSYDSEGRIRQTVDAKGYITDYWYDAAGQPYIISDASKNAIITSFDNLGRKLSVDDPNMGLKSFKYNAFGEVTFEQDANQKHLGTVVEDSTVGHYTIYDELGRVIEKYSNTASDLMPLANATSYKDQFSYCSDKTYLCNSIRSSNEDRTAQLNGFFEVHAKTYQYDEFARPTRETYTTSVNYPGFSDIEFNIVFNYYKDHNWLRQTIYESDRQVGFSVVNHYDGYGNLKRQTQNPVLNLPNNADNELMRITDWNLRGQPTERVLYNDTAMKTGYEYYDGTGQVSQITHSSADPNDQKYNYNYDGWGNIVSQTITNGTNTAGLTEDLTYDELQRLYSAQVGSRTMINYRYDDGQPQGGLGNLMIKSDYSGDQKYGEAGHGYFGSSNTAGPNAITTAVTSNGTKHYHYDRVGNRTSDQLVGITNTYEYDAHNLLTYSHLQQNDQAILFRYGVDNQRYFKLEESIDQDNRDLVEATFYAGPHYELIRNEVAGTVGTVESKFHINQYLTVTRKNSGALQRHFMQKDRLGSTTQILDDQGMVKATKGYDAFGKPRDGDSWVDNNTRLSFESNDSTSLTTDITKRGFTDHEHLDAFELIHMNGRMYDFNNGRFLSVDPFIQGTTSQAINPYSYIQNNPLSGVDPSGYYIIPTNCNPAERNCSAASYTIKDMVDDLSGEFYNGANRFQMLNPGKGNVKLGSVEEVSDIENQGSVTNSATHNLLAQVDTSEKDAQRAYLCSESPGDLRCRSGIGEGVDVVTGALEKPVKVVDALTTPQPEDFIPVVGPLAKAKKVDKVRKAEKSADSTKPLNKIFWGSWDDYPKVIVNGQEYAVIGGRHYSHHAVNRLQPGRRRHSTIDGPSGHSEINIAGDWPDYGRSISPTFVEDVIQNTKPITQSNGNLSYTSGTLQVITNTEGAVITVVTK